MELTEFAFTGLRAKRNVLCGWADGFLWRHDDRFRFRLKEVDCGVVVVVVLSGRGNCWDKISGSFREIRRVGLNTE